MRRHLDTAGSEDVEELALGGLDVHFFISAKPPHTEEPYAGLASNLPTAGG
jgi:hypothetical protein